MNRHPSLRASVFEKRLGLDRLHHRRAHVAFNLAHSVMYITLSWVPLNGTSTADILDDLDHAMPSSDFDTIFDPYPGLRLAVVVDANSKHVSDLHQTLIPLAASRFDYVIAHERKGNFMHVSAGVDSVVCDAIADA